MEYQVTLFSTTGKYRPVSTIVKRAACDINNPLIQKQLLKDGTAKICITHNWDKKDLKLYGYVKGKIRIYDKEKLDKEAEERYNRIKEEKYASGEWKRPKKKGEE